ncbi:hypothetical protein V8G54_013662 [Vigna mungo]|uniref:Uncharacterized protein n=1 Tax=Vigna mungo TaxID=3915 RepID=A0AAQ3NGA5_VIGMU
MRPVDISILMVPSWSSSSGGNWGRVCKTSRGHMWTVIWKWFHWKATWSNRISKWGTTGRTPEPNTALRIIYWRTIPSFIVLRRNTSIRIKLGVSLPFLYAWPHTFLVINLIISPPRIYTFTLNICIYMIIFNTRSLIYLFPEFRRGVRVSLRILVLKLRIQNRLIFIRTKGWKVSRA